MEKYVKETWNWDGVKPGALRGFTNVLIEGKDPGSIVWNETTGLISEVYRREQLLPLEPSDVAWLDGHGFEAYPAGIDLHVHSRPGQPKKEKPENLTMACIEGGVGTIFTMPNGNPPFTRLDQLQSQVEPWGNSPLTVYHHIGASRDNLEEIASLGSVANNQLGQLGGVKIFYASSTGGLLIDDEPTQRRAAKATGKSGRIQVVHAEDEELIKSKRRELEKNGPLSIADHWQVRPSEVEVESIKRVIWICRETGTRFHICHVSTPLGLELIAAAKAEGLPITCETCPHYWRMHLGHLTILGGRVKMNPALRSGAEMLEMERLVCQSPVVDVVSSDHAPHEPEEKAKQEYDKCPSGVPGVQTEVLLTFDLKARGRMSVERFMDLTSGNAARIFGLENKGSLSEGMDADLMLINPRRSTLFTDAKMKSLSRWTPFDGQYVTGSIAAVVLRGKVVKEMSAN